MAQLLIGTKMLMQGRSVVFPFAYAQEGVVKRAPKTRTLRGCGGMLPQKIFIFRASEMPFPIFPGRNFINQSLKER